MFTVILLDLGGVEECVCEMWVCKKAERLKDKEGGKMCLEGEWETV